MTNDPLPTYAIRHRMKLVVCAHAVLFSAALFASFLLAYNFRWVIKVDGEPAVWFYTMFLPLLGIAVPVKLCVFQWGGQYHGTWRYVGLRDLYGVIRATFVSTFLFLVLYFAVENIWTSLYGYPLIDNPPGLALYQSAIFALDWAATIAFVAAARILARFYYEDIQPGRVAAPKTRILIVGAGDTGEAALRELLRMREERYDCVGILDDNAARLNGRIHGVEVIGETSQIREICQEYEVQEVLIAAENATPKRIRELVEHCEGTGVRFRTLPAISDVMEGRVKVSQMRDVEIADLLGRDPVELDTEKIGDQIMNRVVLVTGAGGSIGSELCRQIASFAPKRLALVERSENALFEIDRELRGIAKNFEVITYVADIADKARLHSIFQKERPATVFHAAAHKHVPMMECNVGEAIKNNVCGTMTVADAAMAASVSRMVMISTDKAVNPTSIMGCSKRVAEMYVQGLSGKNSTQFITVRFGNVLGSSGSVVPIFREQILRGGPVTVTDPEMVRYFMTIPEAAQLVLQAGTMGQGGEVYVLHMGKPVKIFDLARDMISLSGLRPGVDIEIAFSGIRPGEKLYEELSFEGEDIGSTSHAKIGSWKHRPEDWDAVCKGIEQLLTLVDSNADDSIREILKRLVPEYQPNSPTDSETASPATLEGAVPGK